MRYLNAAADIHVHPVGSLFGIPLGADVSAGDYLILPGPNDPTRLPFDGGARFDPGAIGIGRADSREWVMHRDVDLAVGVLARYLETGRAEDIPQSVLDTLAVPEWHGGFGANMHAIQVDDGANGLAPLDVVLIRLIAEPTR